MASSSSNDSVTYLNHPLSAAKPISSDSGKTKHAVFLSFHGKDTRNKFTAHLDAALVRHGIPTFIDDREVPVGDVIDDSLKRAINDSKIYIIVFSEKYAYSPWCLNELVEIYKCYENMKRLIIGVYCNIDPSVVRHQKGSFAAALKQHEEGHYKDRKDLVNQWRTTLRNVANLSGKPIPSQRSEAAIIDEIIDAVLLKVNPKTLHVAKYPIGLDSAVKSIMPSLSSDKQEGMIKFGIYGMGGVGKTTLAKAIYNQLLRGGKFKDSSFLAEVRESVLKKGLSSLQEQLINDILKSKIYVNIPNVHLGIMEIENKICLTKILVVIDDLDNKMHFESLVRSFASGSIVIITTRDEHVLDDIKVEPKYRYRVNELDDAHSLALFTQYAFEDAKVNNTLMESYSKDILCLAGGLPLALQVFGSYLSTQQSKVGWKSYIDNLQRYSNSSITKKLMISLDAIEVDDPMLKKIFLDIACLFIGTKKEEVVQILETYYSFADHKIDILKKRCLLTLNNNDELKMHDLLRDMAREVARNKFPHDEPENHSRLWVSEDISKVLTNQMGTKEIECIIHHSDMETSLSFTTETFTGMKKLRFLHLQGGTVSGNFIKISEDLRWLHWDYFPLTYLPSSEFYPQNIVILELRHSKITKWEPKMVFKKLKTLDMSYSLDLVSTPDFDKFPCLETLYLHGCSSLKLLPEDLGNIGSLTKLRAGALNVSKLPDSIGSLNNLVELDLTYNMKLTSLPDTICNLEALEVLRIDRCTLLKKLPTELGNMESLKVLSAEWLSIPELPDSVGSLQKLVELYLSNNSKLASLHDNICKLTALEILQINDCESLKSLPMELGKIKSLRKLSAELLTKVEELPNSIGDLGKLVELSVRANIKLKTLPNTISNLSSLEILDICGCEELNILPDEIWELPSLRELDASGTHLLKKLPDMEPRHISALPLMKLDLSLSGITDLPWGFSQLSKLENLDLCGCYHLVSIPELPPNLKWISASCCKSLEYLFFTDCSGLMEIEDLYDVTSLKELHLGGCNLSLLADTLTRRFFQLWSGFGHEIKIYTPSAYLPEWISQSPYWISGHKGSTMFLELLPKVPHNFLGIILCFKHIGVDKSYQTTYSVKINTKSDLVWRNGFTNENNEAQIMIVPASIFSVRDGERFEVTANQEIHGIHLLYKTEI